MHREALKQSATDPLSGKIDVNILTTGLSSAARKRRQELTDALRKLIQSKGKGVSLNYQKVLSEMKENSQIVSEQIVILLMLIWSVIIYLCESGGGACMHALYE